MVTEATKENFSEIIENNDIVIVDFWAPWCGPCKNFAPIFEKTAEAHPEVAFIKINTEEQQELAAHFQIRSIPTLMVFREQVMLFAQPGMMQESQLTELLGKVSELDMAEVHKEVARQETSEAKEASA